ncbi:hypothetical protein P168DRAFT_90037 [Aspergillus campestris IBT 28561]|uniref:BTB domain-containing protein n=1 Tax=Aspergillus campestris (strain IBT 28561) TaxID=1392248 RepID=A0A2I1DBD0_ASPC2|nr:uncharacterized protein P168DRAFT_90037 [Aspergillus campestris IBT 28561]PKY07188.1 hypothetical protein P168DRAFT_90037 [Aspergillus campestris IBT 28561]
MTNASEASAEHFVNNILPLYQGPSVKLRIQPTNKEYTISKSLLCAESPVFSRMFNGEFIESQQQTATLEETDDGVSVRSLEALFQWLYQHTVRFAIKDPGEHISAAMELARLADMYEINGLETTLAQYIRNIIKHNPDPMTGGYCRHVDTNTYCLTQDHIASATLLPRGHPVRSVLAAASVEGFLRHADYKFCEEAQAYPSFGADLLQEIRLVLHKLEPRAAAKFEDPISGERSYIS